MVALIIYCYLFLLNNYIIYHWILLFNYYHLLLSVNRSV